MLLLSLLFSISCGVFAVHPMDRVLKNYHGQAYLDFRQKYHLEWNIDWRNNLMLFNITVATSGWIGFGFSKDGNMKDADMVITGVSPDRRRSYITDFHADCQRRLIADNKQDWNLLGSSEVNGKTTVQISRLIDTCDNDDYPITDDLVFLLWAFGDTDDSTEYHHQNRGSYTLYLLDPVVHPAPSSNFLPKWRVTRDFTLPPKPTIYWCSIFKAPPSNRKQHLISFRAVLENPHELAVKHVHHFVLWRCFAPPGIDPRPIFEPLLSYIGEECYINDKPRIPLNLCRKLVYVWALGGRPLILPDHVGFPFTESPDEYYMLETHYDNPEGVGGIRFVSGVEATYTRRLRSQDGGAFMIDYDLAGFFMIPPGTQQFQLLSHCSPDCTQIMFPPEGLDVFAIHSHAHRSGKKFKMRQYRSGKELPWIVKDDNYYWLFQTPRPLQVDRKLLPGDYLKLECTYDDTWTNMTTVAGYPGRDEMCLQVFYHTINIPYSYCQAVIPQENLLRLVGVTNTTWDPFSEERVVTSPPALKGIFLDHVLDDLTHWTQQLRDSVQTKTITEPQINTCPFADPVDPQNSTGTFIFRPPVVQEEFSRRRVCPKPLRV